MGYCCSQQGAGEEGNLATALYPQGATLDGHHYTAKDIWIIVKIQSAFRMYMAKRRVQMLRNEIYSPGMVNMQHQHGGEDFENINVQVSYSFKAPGRPDTKPRTEILPHLKSGQVMARLFLFMTFW